MLTRVLHTKWRPGGGCGNKERQEGSIGGGGGSRSISQHHLSDDDDPWPTRGEYADQVTFCGPDRPCRLIVLEELLMSSVQLLGESGLGICHKVLLPDAPVMCAKRFQRVLAHKREYNKCMERLAQAGLRCQYLVPVQGYLYTKRIKVVLCNYYPMGSLADLLVGARELGHTPLDWQMRLTIILHVATAIAFIHAQPGPYDKTLLRLNVHGNIKPSNVFISTDFSAQLSDYGFVQLAQRMEPAAVSPSRRPQDLTKFESSLSQAGDIYNFGAMVLDVLGGSMEPLEMRCLPDKREEIREGRIKFFEFSADGCIRRQACKVMEIALDCIHPHPEARPTIAHILGGMTEVFSIK